MESRGKKWGPEDRDTLVSINTLANMLMDQGKLGEAEPLFRRALESRERTLGRDHYDTLASASNLAALLKAKGKMEEAVPAPSAGM